MKLPIKMAIALAAVASLAFVNPKAKSKPVNIVIDAGHGGKDFGATYENTTEKEIVAQISEKIKSFNDDQNIVIHFTRTSDENISLADRTALINKIKPDLVLSLHVNANADTANSGMDIFIPETSNATSEKSQKYAGLLSDKLVRNHSVKFLGIKQAPLSILKKSEVPAMVVELGFLSNANDRKYLTDPNQQGRIAETILEFIREME